MDAGSRTGSRGHAVLTTVLGAIVVLALSGTGLRAQEERTDRKVLDAILGGIGFPRNKPVIDYRERSPLVVPPSRDLPPPQTDAMAAAKNPAWPVDQDAKRAEELERKRKGTSGVEEFNDWASGRELTPAELRDIDKRARASGAGRDRAVTRASSVPGEDELKPRELGFKGWTLKKFFGGKDQTETTDFIEEPVRETLIEPPAGYRTPSPDQPYGINKTKTPSKAYDVKDKDTHKPF